MLLKITKTLISSVKHNERKRLNNANKKLYNTGYTASKFFVAFGVVSSFRCFVLYLSFYNKHIEQKK